MYQLRKIVVTVILLFYHYQISVSDSAVRYYSKVRKSYYNIDDGKFLKTDPNIYFYVEYNFNNTKIDCDVGRETWVFENGTLEESCNYTFYAGENREFVGTLRMAPITESKVLLALSDVVNTEKGSELMQNYYITIDMNDCTMTNFTIFDEKPFESNFAGKILLPPTIYDNSYQVILVNKTLCRTNELCKLSFDFNGKLIGAHEFNLPSYLTYFPYYVHAVNDSSPEKGVYLRASNNDFYRKNDELFSKIELFYFNKNGKSTKITEVKMINGYLNNPIVSTSSHELYSMCWKSLTSSESKNQETNKIQCIQTDTKKVKLNINLEFKESVNWLMVDSLPGGGMVLISGHCKRLIWDCVGFQILTINADGSKNRLLKVEGHEFDCIPREEFPFGQYDFQIIDNGDEICFNIGCHAMIPSYSRNCIKKKFIFVPFKS